MGNLNVIFDMKNVQLEKIIASNKFEDIRSRTITDVRGCDVLPPKYLRKN